MNNSLTNNSDLKGCFWNPMHEKFTCVVAVAWYYPITSECKESCPRVCSEHYWKCNEECIPISQKCDGTCMKYFTFDCNDLCIPISQKCNGHCMPYYTFECNGSCIPVNKPCNSLCYNEYTEINCNGKCFDTRYEIEKIIQSGCKGEIQSLIKFSLMEMLKLSCRSSMKVV
jgi:hypothetical protein